MQESTGQPGDDSDLKWKRACRGFVSALGACFLLAAAAFALAAYGQQFWTIPIGLGMICVMGLIVYSAKNSQDVVEQLRDEIEQMHDQTDGYQQDLEDYDLIHREFRPPQEQVDKVLKRFALRIEAAESPQERQKEIQAYEDLAGLLLADGYLTGSWQQHVRDEDSEPAIGHV